MKKDTDELRQEYELKAMPQLMSGPEYLEYCRKRQGMPGEAVFLEPDEAPIKPILYPDSDGQPMAEHQTIRVDRHPGGRSADSVCR